MVEANAVAAVAEDVVAIENNLTRDFLIGLHRPVPVATPAVVADAVAAQRIGPWRAIDADAVLAVAVEHAARKQAAAAGDAAGAGGRHGKAGFAVLDHQAVGDDDAVGAPIR